MALTDLISNVANKAGYVVADTVIGSNDTTTKQLLALLQTVNEDVMEAYNWPGLMRSTTITLVTGQAQYDVAADFSFHHYDTFWNQSTTWQLYGALSNQEYADINGYGLDSTVPAKFLIRGIVNKKIEISPVPTASENGEVVYYLYHSARYVKPITWAAGLSFTSGDYCIYNNNYYISETTGTSGATPPIHTTGSVTDGTITWLYTNNAYRTFIDDTDGTILPQRIIEQGLLEAYNDQKGLTYTPRFEQMVIDEFRRERPASSISTSYSQHRYQFGANGRFYFGHSS